MKLTWTFYVKNNQGQSESVTLTVIYVPEFDAENLKSGGFRDVNSNTAFVDWATYRRFDSADVGNRKEAFQLLTVLSKGGGVIVNQKRIDLSGYRSESKV